MPPFPKVIGMPCALYSTLASAVVTALDEDGTKKLKAMGAMRPRRRLESRAEEKLEGDQKETTRQALAWHGPLSL